MTNTTTSTEADAKTKPLRIGVLIHPPVQFLDVSPIDLFGMLTKDYLQACSLPAPLINLGIDVQISYISSSSSSSSSPAESPPHLAPLTSSASLLLTTTIASPSVAPGTLDLILIPGPDPRVEIPEEVGGWVRGHFESGRGGGGDGKGDGKEEGGKEGGGKEGGGVVLMSVCTGIFVLAGSGVLEGRRATGPRGLLGVLRGRWKGTRWMEERWVRDGEIWSSGGITNGLDMVAAYLREKYPGPLSDTVCMLADVGDRGQEYGSGKIKSNGLWLWAILRAWWMGA